MGLIADNLKECYNLRKGIYGYEIFEYKLNILKQQGKENTPEFADVKSKMDLQKSKYLNSGCGNNKDLEDCLMLDNTRKSLIEDIASFAKLSIIDNNNTTDVVKKNLSDIKTQYELKGCAKKIAELEQAETNKTISQFTALDEARISEETKYQTQQRVFFGGLVLVAGLVIITMFNGKKK